jgi:hypothetical protein
MGSHDKYIDPSLALTSLALGSDCVQDDIPEKIRRNEKLQLGQGLQQAASLQ